jgi:hypothetical protein
VCLYGLSCARKGSAKERRELHLRMLENEKINEDARRRLREVIGSGVGGALYPPNEPD